AAVGLQSAKHQLQDAIEQIAEVGDVADRLAQLVEDAEVGQQLVGERALDFFGVGEDAAALALADALDDGAGQLNVLARDQTDLLGKVAAAGVVSPSAGEDEHALADLNLIARLQSGVIDRGVIDEGAVGAADIAQVVAFALVGLLIQFGVTA